MKRSMVVCLTAALCAALLPGAVKPAISRSGTAAKGKAKAGSTVGSKTSGKTAAKAKASRKGRKVAAAPARHYFQAAPTAERYQEIQKALADKGFYKGEVNGQWGPDSVTALRDFQSDQKLQSDGKIGSLSLIALGLGPHRQVASRTQPPAERPQ